MARYIDMNEIFPNGVYYVNGNDPMSSLTELINRIHSLPTADVEEVIRCENCSHNVANKVIDELDETDYSGKDIVCDYFMVDGMNPTDYCSHGERIKHA